MHNGCRLPPGLLSRASRWVGAAFCPAAWVLGRRRAARPRQARCRQEGPSPRAPAVCDSVLNLKRVVHSQARSTITLRSESNRKSQASQIVNLKRVMPAPRKKCGLASPTGFFCRSTVTQHAHGRAAPTRPTSSCSDRLGGPTSTSWPAWQGKAGPKRRFR